MYRKGIIIYLVFVAGIISCSKKKLEEKAYEPSVMNKFFEDYILNKDISVSIAKYEGRDTSAMYAGYSFKLLRNTYYDGPFEARVNGVLYTGTWQCNEDYSKLTLNISGTGALDWVKLNWKY